MEAILASVRRILAEDERNAPARDTVGVLELTEALNDDGSVRQVGLPSEPSAAAVPPPSDGRVEPEPPRPEVPPLDKDFPGDRAGDEQRGKERAARVQPFIWRRGRGFRATGQRAARAPRGATSGSAAPIRRSRTSSATCCARCCRRGSTSICPAIVERLVRAGNCARRRRSRLALPDTTPRGRLAAAAV